MGLDAMILFFWMSIFKPAFSLSSFTFIKRLFSSLSAIRVVSSVYLRLLIFFLAILIPGCVSSSLAFHMMHSAHRSKKQGDNIHTWHTPFPVWKGLSSQCYGFSSSHIWVQELYYKESWVLKNWCFWTVVVEKTLERDPWTERSTSRLSIVTLLAWRICRVHHGKCQAGWSTGWNQYWVGRYKLLHLEWINNKVLIHSTRNY